MKKVLKNQKNERTNEKGKWKKKKKSSETERVEFVFHSHECNSECP